MSRFPLIGSEKCCGRSVIEIPTSRSRNGSTSPKEPVRNYLSSAIVKLGARGRTEAFAKAQEMGYL